MRKQSEKKQNHIKLLQENYGFKGSYAQLKDLELYARNLAMDECNHPMEQDEIKRRERHVIERLQDIFDYSKLEDVFKFNKDARGYALKIKPEAKPEEMIMDWGKNGLLCPWEEL